MSADLPDFTGSVEPDQLIDALRAAGWTDAGGRSGLYVRLAWPSTVDGRPRSTSVPLDKTAGDYPDLLNGSIAELAHFAKLGALAQQVLAGLLPNHIFVTYDGDTYWLACFAADPDAEHGYPIHPIDAGDTWPELLAQVASHRCLDEGGHDDA